MFTMVAGEARELQPGLESALAAYRYRVFVKELGWPLPVQDGLERDDFDRPWPRPAGRSPRPARLDRAGLGAAGQSLSAMM